MEFFPQSDPLDHRSLSGFREHEATRILFVTTTPPLPLLSGMLVHLRVPLHTTW